MPEPRAPFRFAPLSEIGGRGKGTAAKRDPKPKTDQLRPLAEIGRLGVGVGGEMKKKKKKNGYGLFPGAEKGDYRGGGGGGAGE